MNKKIEFYPYLVSIIFVLIGTLFYRYDIVFAVGLALFSFLYCYSRFRRNRFFAFDVIFLFVSAMGITAIGNLLGVLSVGQVNEEIYMIYAKRDYFEEVNILMYISTILISIGFHWGVRFSILPRIKIIKATQGGAAFLFYLALLSIVLKGSRLLPNLGSISNAIYLLPVLSIFLLARLSFSYRKSRLDDYALILFLITTTYSVLFEYLRMNMVLPAVAYILGHLIGARTTKSLIGPKMYVVYIFLGFFLTYFAVFGEIRQQYVQGTERITLIQQVSEEQEVKGTLYSRLSVLNQVSNIFYLVDRNNFYKGQTLEYLGFALIPRFLWPEKPAIAKGRWYALEIGQAIDYGGGKVSNSINMTVPGELYLNYGWQGVFIGCLFFGIVISAFWNTTSFWSGDNNVFGNLFGFYLLFMGLFSLGADIQVLVTILALYLVFYLISKLVAAF